MFLPLRALLAVGVLALVSSLLGLPLAPTANAAGEGVRLTVRLDVLNQPTWGDDLRVQIETNQPDELGYVQLHRVNPDGSLLLLATPEDEGVVVVDSRLLGAVPGSHQLIATASRGDAGAESLKRSVTVSKRPTSVTFLDSSVAPLDPVRVQVGSGAGHLVPTGDVVFVGPGFGE